MKHPNRYPTHSGDKGTTFGGVCNRTACDCGNAVFYNRMTYGYYCVVDAREINWKTQICIRVDHEQSIEEMNAHYKDAMKLNF